MIIDHTSHNVMKLLMKDTKGIAAILCILFLSSIVAVAQEGQRYSKNGISFDYPDGWQMSEKQKAEGDEVALSNAAADAQILVITVNKKVDAKNADDARKRVFAPWLKTLEMMYTHAKIGYTTYIESTDVAGVPADGVRLLLDYGGEPGTVKAFWILKDKRFVIVYMVRNDAKAAAANVGWDKLRESLRVEAAAK
jgi:hypothetical protein